MSVKTSNYYQASLKQFCSWLSEDGRVPKDENPVSHLQAINAETDIRWERRALNEDEFAHSDVNLTMGVYSHVEVSDQTVAINSLPSPPNPNGVDHEIPHAPTEHGDGLKKSVDHIVDQTFGSPCPGVSSGGAGRSAEAADEINQKPLSQQDLVALCRALASNDASSGGGTRTPDTRIMIPLL